MALIDSHEKKVDDTDKGFGIKISKGTPKEALDAEKQIMQLKMAMQSLQEKVSDITSENQILRQQAFSSTTSTPVTNDNVDALIECLMRDTGFSQGKPVAAFTIYKCLVHWKSFESERTSVFDRLHQMIGLAIMVRPQYDKSAIKIEANLRYSHFLNL